MLWIVESGIWYDEEKNVWCVNMAPGGLQRNGSFGRTTSVAMQIQIAGTRDSGRKAQRRMNGPRARDV